MHHSFINRFVIMGFIGLLTLSGASSCQAQTQSLSKIEADIVSWIDNNNDDAISLIEESVNINSGTLNIAGVKSVSEHLRPHFDALGFETEWVELPADMERAGHLMARREGTQGRKVLLIGHLDTVFEKDEDFQKFVRNGNMASGPGVADMKSGNVIILQALRALQSVGALDDVQVVVALTGDEESPGMPIATTRGPLIEASRWADVALEFETGVRDEDGEWATISRRGYMGWCLEVTGTQAHSSLIFNDENGAGAIFETSRILNGFYDTVRGEPFLTFNAGTIVGGTEINGSCATASSDVFGKPNVIPNSVIVRGEIRTLTEDQAAGAQAAMLDIVSKSLPRTKAKLTFDEGYPAMAPTDGNKALQVMLSEINVELGRNPMPALDPLRRGASDVSFAAPYTDALAGLGGYGEGLHSPNEKLDLESIPIATKRAALLIYRLTR